MEMFDLRADYKTLPDETLRRHFRRLIKRQRRFAAFTFALLIPAAIIYGMMGWANYFAAESAMFAFFDVSSNAFFNYVAFAASGALLVADTVKLIAASPAVMILYMGLKIGLFDSVSGDTFVMLAYLIVAAVITAKLCLTLISCVNSPTFPSTAEKSV